MNINAETIINFWGKDNLIRISKESMHQLTLPDETKEFLANVGVIRASDLMMDGLGILFDAAWDGNLITLASHFDCEFQVNGFPESLQSWTVLGHCFDYKLICTRADDGSVVNLEGEPESGFMDWFVNSSVEQFVLFITLAVQSFENGLGELTVAQALQLLRQSLSEADPEAMRERTHWWPLILSDIQIVGFH